MITSPRKLRVDLGEATTRTFALQGESSKFIQVTGWASDTGSALERQRDHPNRVVPAVISRLVAVEATGIDRLQHKNLHSGADLAIFLVILTTNAVRARQAVGTIPRFDIAMFRKANEMCDWLQIWVRSRPAQPGAMSEKRQPRMRPDVGTPVPAVTRTCSTSGTGFTDVPRSCRTPSAIPFMPWMYASPS